jgi:hypothetical protein
MDRAALVFTHKDLQAVQQTVQGFMLRAAVAAVQAPWAQTETQA